MLDDLLSKEDLKAQAEFYDSEIARLTNEITASKNIRAIRQRQLDGITACIEQIKLADTFDTNSTAVYKEMLKKIIVYEKGTTEIYLNCVPFGFRLTYHIKRFNKIQRYNVFIDSCTVVS